VAAWFAGPGPVDGRHFVVGAPAQASAPAVGEAWQNDAIGLGRIAPTSFAAAARIKVAVIDTGIDASAGLLAGKRITGYAVNAKLASTADQNGHGTFVTSILAAVAGDAPILVVKVAGADGSVTDAGEAAGIRYAVDHGARVINMSIAGSRTSRLERDAVSYAVRRGALIVAAAGNDFERGNPVEYPAALLQPVASNGKGGAGLVVAASSPDGTRAPFSGAGSWISLAAPGMSIRGALTANASGNFLRATADTGYASGTSYAAPQVAGAAALVWAANPALTARQVAQILKETASGRGAWTADLGFGVIDVPAAVDRAAATLTG
jgi:subtilisin family serine protease